MTETVQVLAKATAPVLVLLALVLLYQSAAGRKLLFDLAARIVGKLGERIEAHAVTVLDAAADRLLDRLDAKDQLAAQEVQMIRYERATGASPFDDDSDLYESNIPY